MDPKLPSDKELELKFNKNLGMKAQSKDTQALQKDEHKLEVSSEGEQGLLNRNEVIEMFEKMAKESIQKLTLNDSSDSNSDSNDSNEMEELDKLINTEPQKLILINGHDSKQITEQIDSINKEIATEHELEVGEKLQSILKSRSSDNIPLIKDKLEVEISKDIDDNLKLKEHHNSAQVKVKTELQNKVKQGHKDDNSELHKNKDSQLDSEDILANEDEESLKENAEDGK